MAQFKETHVVSFLSCCGLIGLGAFAGLVVLLNSIHTLGPEDQVLVDGPDGKYVRNGPDTVVLAPERKKVFRSAHKLSAREYAVVKNFRSGEVRHQPGPSLMFLGAYEIVDEVLPMILLQRDEYLVLVDLFTGMERVIPGPDAVVPRPLEASPNGVQKAVVLGMDKAVLIRLKTTGMLSLVDTGGVVIPEPYEEIVEIRTATVLTHREYAVVKSNLDGSLRHVPGPRLLQVGAYEEIASVENKMILRKDEYIRLRNKKDGSERVVNGPSAFVPEPEEHTLEGKQRATFLDLDTAALVLNRSNGQQRLVTERGVFVPSPYEQVLEKRQLIRVLGHESVVVCNHQGQTSILGGGDPVSFFLQPYHKLLELSWSSFSQDLPQDGVQAMSKIKVSKIDMRSRKMLFRYSCHTSDNVKLILDGTIFWRVVSVAKLISTTSDPSGDVWHHARSALIQSVSKTTLANFMIKLNDVSDEAFMTQVNDGFDAERGVELESMKISRFEVADPQTAQVLHSIILETTNRMNRLQTQASSDEVKAAGLAADIQLEKKRTELVIHHATNMRLQSEMAGDIEGLRRLGFAQEFLGGLNASVPDLDQRLDLYKHYFNIQSHNEMTRDIGAGGKRLFISPTELGIGIKMEL